MDIHTAFGLTYANYLILDGPTLQKADQVVVARLKVMLTELWSSFTPEFGSVERVALLAEEHEFDDLTEEQMTRLGVVWNMDFVHQDCDCGEEPDSDDDESQADYSKRYSDWSHRRDEHELDELLWEYRGQQYRIGQSEVFPVETVEQARQINRLVVPRTLLQSMPADWQQLFVTVLNNLPRADCSFDVQVFDANGNPIDDPVPHYNRGRTQLEPAGMTA
jgi:hypothetical protein